MFASLVAEADLTGSARFELQLLGDDHLLQDIGDEYSVELESEPEDRNK